MSLTRKIAAVGLLGNVALIGGILYRRKQHLDEEEAAKAKWEAARNDSDLKCFFVAKQYYDQCSFEPDDAQECTRLAGLMDECKNLVGSLVPKDTVLPAMRPSFLQYKS